MQEWKIFEEKQIRTVWDEVQEKWYFCIIDIVQILTESKDYLTARKYWNKLKQRLVSEDNETVTNCHQLKLSAADGKLRYFDVADLEHPQTMSEHARVAERGGSVARVAKEAFEEQTGKKVVNSLSMKQYLESQQPKLDLEDEQ